MDIGGKTDRRTVLAAAAVAGFGVAQAAPAASGYPAPGLEYAFEALVEIAEPQQGGATPFGKRVRIPITGGTFEGPKIKGKVLPGGADWQLIRADGCVTVEADYMIQADDGALIHVHNRGVLRTTPDFYLYTTPIFEAPLGPHDWLNRSVFISRVVPLAPGKGVAVRVFRVAG